MAVTMNSDSGEIVLDRDKLLGFRQLAASDKGDLAANADASFNKRSEVPPATPPSGAPDDSATVGGK